MNDKEFSKRVIERFKQKQILKKEGQVEISPATKLSKITINKKVLKTLAGLSKKKVISRKIVKKGKKPILVIKSSKLISKAKNIFFKEVGGGV